MIYIAHKREDGKKQSLLEHQKAVSRLAGQFAAPFHAEKDARLAGLYHDEGKYSEAGQRRMNDPEHTPKVDHSTAGAQIVSKYSLAASFAVAGHLAGLPDKGERVSMSGASDLIGRLKKNLTGNLSYGDCWKELPSQFNEMPYMPAWVDPNDSFSTQFYVRMLFSCLVDADYLDTEAFMQDTDDEYRGHFDTIDTLFERFQPLVHKLSDYPTNELNALRSKILQSCIQAGEMPSGIYSLTVPTGGGKTLSSMAYALKHAVTYHKKRIIYVVPYTSIIEQNAEIYREIFGNDNVLEHHSNALFWQQDDVFSDKAALAAENWESPIIVTTAVQFFESLFSAKPSRCRKLHNISNSVLIFDEAQMLPISYLIPCVAAISELVKHYNADAVLCTATQPALNGLFEKYSGQKLVEICPAELQNAKLFRRAEYRIEPGAITEEQLTRTLQSHNQVLCIVNMRSTAQNVFDLLPENEAKYHLSTNMTPSHRKKVIDKIRERLNQHLPCYVVSTSLIEAGVDVDFPAVYRELAGLDSILQAGGRCNREGKKNPWESIVTVFQLDKHSPKQFEQQIASTEFVLSLMQTIDDSESIPAYFHFLMEIRGADQLDNQNIMDYCRQYAFRKINQHFHLIDDDTVSIYIPNTENAEDIRLLSLGHENRQLMRRLGKDAVNVYPNIYGNLMNSGSLDLTPNGYAVLRKPELYDPEKGLRMTVPQTGYACFL